MFLHHFLGNTKNDFLLVGKLFLGTHKRNHDFRKDLLPFLCQFTDRFKNGSRLHLDDLRIRDPETATPVTEHGIKF